MLSGGDLLLPASPLFTQVSGLPSRKRSIGVGFRASGRWPVRQKRRKSITACVLTSRIRSMPIRPSRRR